MYGHHDLSWLQYNPVPDQIELRAIDVPRQNQNAEVALQYQIPGAFLFLKYDGEYLDVNVICMNLLTFDSLGLLTSNSPTKMSFYRDRILA
jgi:hypothetical protein